MNKPAVRV